MIAQLLPADPTRDALAQAAAMAFDGAIVRAQMAPDAVQRQAAADTLRLMLRSLVRLDDR